MPRPSPDFRETPAVIKVVGVGGAGGNAVDRMIQAGLKGVEFISANTDAQVLRDNKADIRIQIGESLTKGLGVGGDPSRGRDAMLESRDQLKEYLAGSDLVFITSGMGGGTGTGGAPIVARVARDLGALTIGVVTRPFDFEGRLRSAIAEAGIAEMRQNVDTLLTIPNQRIFDVIDAKTPCDEAYRRADDVLRKAIQCISDVITVSGAINMDLNDMRAIMKDAGEALIGMAEESGPGRALKAARAAVSSPLLENVSMDGAKGLIVNVTGSAQGLMLSEVDEAMKFITDTASPEARIKHGHAYDDTLGGRIRITVIATGFPPRRRRGLGGQGSLRSPAGPDVPANVRPATGATPDDFNKPAYLRMKPRKLVI